MKPPVLLAAAVVIAFAGAARAQEAAIRPPASADADSRAAAIERQMTDDERVRLTHGLMAWLVVQKEGLPPDAIPGGAGYVAGIDRLGVPALRETDASLGVAYVLGARHDGATALPSGLASAASFDPALGYDEGAMIGREAWRKGFNVLLAGGVNLARDPWGGRNFEYLGEDPLLAGTLAGASIRGIQDQHVIATVKHFAFNDQETGRHVMSADIGEAAARESDLLAFELAIEAGRPGAVMCAYNRVNDQPACGSDALLDQVLKDDWRYPGWVMSDWGTVPGLDAAMGGLDQQSGEQLDQQVFLGKPLLEAAQGDVRYRRRLADMDRRILRSILAVGLIDHPPVPAPIDLDADAAVARKAADEGIVLLVNRAGLLPLARAARTIAVIGGHADAGTISGGGSSQVAPAAGPAVVVPMGGDNAMDQALRRAFYLPSSPLNAIRAAAPQAQLRFDDGAYPSAAARLAAASDVAVVFVTQWMSEGADAPDLSLPQGQDQLIAAVAAANPRTVVVLETGGPVLMPWLEQVGALVEAWYPGARGGEAIADVLFGGVDPSGRLPITFPAALAQAPRPEIPGWQPGDSGRGPATGGHGAPFAVDYDIEGSDVGYRWYARQRLKPLFPFGFGLSYTRFALGRLRVARGDKVRASFTVTNTGERGGADTPQVYLVSGPQGARRRLLGFARVDLAPHETRQVSVSVDPRLLADWDIAAHGWRIGAGDYRLAVGESAEDLALTQAVRLPLRRLAP